MPIQSFKKFLKPKRSINDHFDSFLDGNLRNAWIQHPAKSNDPHIKAYVRKATRYHQGKLVSSLDIASVDVHPKHEHKGLFKSFIKHVENHVNSGKADITTVECINNKKLETDLRKHGYKDDRDAGLGFGPPTLIKPRS